MRKGLLNRRGDATTAFQENLADLGAGLLKRGGLVRWQRAGCGRARHVAIDKMSELAMRH